MLCVDDMRTAFIAASLLLLSSPALAFDPPAASPAASASPALPAPPAPPPPDAPPAPAAAPAEAAPAPLPPAPAAPPGDAGARDVAWQRDFATARALLLAGDFQSAATRLGDLVRRARTPEQAAVATELSMLALDLERRELMFVRRPNMAQGKAPGVPADVRTTDEIAVLYSTAVAYGLGGGVWLGTLTDPETAAGGILPALGLAAGAAGTVYAIDNMGDRPLGYGVAQSISSGVYLGLGEGLLWTLWNQASVDSQDEWESEAVSSVLFGGATLGAIVGGTLGSVYGTTPGRAAFVTSAASWTATLGGLVAATATPDSRESYRDDNALLTAAVGLNVGAALGMGFATSVSPSVARVRFIDLGGASGAIVAGGLYIAAADADISFTGFSAVTSLGIAAGLGTAYWLTSDMAPDSRPDERGTLASLGVDVAPTPGGASLAVHGAF